MNSVKEITDRERWVLTRVEEISREHPTKTAMIYLGEKITYKKLMEYVYRFASSLRKIGIGVGDRVMIYLPNSPQYVISLLAVFRIGATAVPISPIYPAAEVEYMARDSEATAIISADTNFGYVKQVMPNTKIKKVIVTNVADMLPLYKRLIGRLFDKIPTGGISKGENVYSFTDLLRSGSPTPTPIDFDIDDIYSVVLYTSGTTGVPKGVVHTHRTLMSNAASVRLFYGEPFFKDGEEVVLPALYLFHRFGLDVLFGWVLHRGNTMVVLPKLTNIDAVLESIQRYKCTMLLAAPTLYRYILECDRLDQYDLSSLKYCASGGDVLPREVYNRWKELVGVPIYQVYGATEVGEIALTPAGDPDPPDRCTGKPIPDRDVKVIDPDTGELLPKGEEGEIVVSGSSLMLYYLNKPEETRDSIIELDGKRYYRTGDYGFIGDDGQIYFTDRRKDVIKYKGYRVAAAEVESVLKSHPAVINACVVGVPDPKVGERIKAFVVLKEDARGVTAQDLIRWCRERLAPYKVPHYIEFRDALPISKVGKLLRREMREEELRKISKEGAK